MTVRTPVVIRFSDVDLYGHVNHAVYLSYFEAARVEVLDRLGFGLRRLKSSGFHLVVAEVTVRFVRPAVWGDALSVETEVVEVRRATCRWHQRLCCDDQVVADLSLRAACTDLDGRPVATPTDFAAALRTLAAPT